MNPLDLSPRQLDQALRASAERRFLVPPRGGWLKAIRTALGITTRQFAARVGLAHSTIVEAEQSEAAGTITLAQLRRLADALDCDLRYVLVPRTPLAERIDTQAELKAREQVSGAAHTMALEAQGTDSAFQEQQVAAAKDQLLRGRRSRLWD
jgi:predicted DNA-binding mobile mystery protein A